MVVHASCVQKPAWSMFSWRHQKWNDDIIHDMKKILAKEVGRSTPELRNPCHQLPWRKRQVTRKGSLRALMIKLVALGSTSTFAWRFLSSRSCTHAVAATLIRLKFPEHVGFWIDSLRKDQKISEVTVAADKTKKTHTSLFNRQVELVQ